MTVIAVVAMAFGAAGVMSVLATARHREVLVPVRVRRDRRF